MPLLRTETGCRWRKTFVSITTTRFRRSRGAGWRKTLFQTCELRMKSPTDMPDPFKAHGLQPVGLASHLDVRLRVLPLAKLFLELLALVHDELAVVADADGPALERSVGGALEVDAGDL